MPALFEKDNVMNVQFQTDRRMAGRRLPFECVALVLQGGGALGAYQAGVYEALAEADIHPDWVAGVSIGAINSAIVAGNAPAERVAKLRAFWQEITTNPLLDWAAAADALTPKGDLPRALFNQLSATCAVFAGAASFFTVRQPAPWLHPDGSLEATSFYETKLLKRTLERLVDFDRINTGEMRLSVGTLTCAPAISSTSTTRPIRSDPST
jgi:NTE family protein